MTVGKRLNQTRLQFQSPKDAKVEMDDSGLLNHDMLGQQTPSTGQ